VLRRWFIISEENGMAMEGDKKKLILAVVLFIAAGALIAWNIFG
jgi:hypothetical protein